MSMSHTTDEIPNGSGAAAILGAGIGCGVLGLLAFWGDASDSMGKTLNFYHPSGTLSGVTSIGILIWLVAWFVLSRMWSGKTVEIMKVNVAAFALLAVGFLLTFPPFMDLLQGK